MATVTTTTITEAMSHVLDALDSLDEYDYGNSRYYRDPWVRDGASALRRALLPIESALHESATPTPSARYSALDLLIALEGGLSATDSRTYAVDRARVTPLIEDMLASIILGKVKFDTEVK